MKYKNELCILYTYGTYIDKLDYSIQREGHIYRRMIGQGGHVPFAITFPSNF